MTKTRPINSIQSTREFAETLAILKRGNWTGAEKVRIAGAMLNYGATETFKFDWWQDRYIRHDHQFLITNKSRRIGWSFITALKGVLNAIDPASTNYTKQFVSYTMEDAKEKISVAREFYMSIPEAFRSKKLVSDSKTSLEFQDMNGRGRSRLLSWPCKAPRGKGGDISLDEFAFHAKDKDIYVGSLPVISRGGNLEIGSTPFGNKGYFHDILNDKIQYPQFKRFEVFWWMSEALCRNVYDAMKDSHALPTRELVERYGTAIIQQIFDSMSLDDFQQEYEGKFRDELAAFITLAMIQSCTPVGDDELIPFRSIDDFIIGYDPDVHGYLYAGYDVGRTNDASELNIIGYKPDTGKKSIWAAISYKQMGFETQQANLVQLMTGLPIHRLCIDATGLGMQLAEFMETRFPRKVEPCMFTGPLKEEMSENLWLGFDKQEFILPADRELQKQIHSIKKTVTASKNSRFDCDANEKHHADRYWSLALSNRAVAAGNSASSGGFYRQYSKKITAEKTSQPRTLQGVLSRQRRIV